MSAPSIQRGPSGARRRGAGVPGNFRRSASLTASVLLMLACSGCSKPIAPAPVAKPTPLAAPPPQTSYCERLQPLLDKTVRAARIGTEMACLEMPGITELGRYGPPSAGEEESLANCFDDRSTYDRLVHAPESPFELSIDQAFQSTTEQGVGLGLSTLVPWLPRIDVSNSRGARLTARVTIRDARFVTLVGLASQIQGQAAEQRCLQALCSADYTYVHKALIGTPSVVIRASDEFGNSLDVSPLAANVHFAEREVSQGTREITSKAPVTLAVARSAFNTEQTERLCEFCGKRGQACCSADPACDGGLGCVAERCVEVGGPGQPCDGESCSAGRACVRGTCRVECGGRGQSCCGGSECSGGLRCSPDPENGSEHAIASQIVEVEGGFFGTDEDRAFGSSSCGPLRKRLRFAVTKVGAGRGECQKAWWFDPENERDCRVGVHFGVSPFGTIQCRIDVFAKPPPKPNLCLPY